jgi:quercetin dioxygenase-like cupin family protein
MPPLAGPRAFARHMLRDQALQLQPVVDGCRSRGGVTELVLFRDGCWQVSMITMVAGTAIARHRHPRVETVDLLVAGGGRAEVEGRVFGVPRGRFGAGLMRVPQGAWHEGHAGPDGVAYLSFQRWADGAPGFLLEDWQAW